MGCAQGFAPEAALEDLGLPQGGPGVEVLQLLGSQGPWPHQKLSEASSQGSRKHSALERYGSPLQYSCLGNPTDRKA